MYSEGPFGNPQHGYRASLCLIPLDPAEVQTTASAKSPSGHREPEFTTRFRDLVLGFSFKGLKVLGFSFKGLKVLGFSFKGLKVLGLGFTGLGCSGCFVHKSLMWDATVGPAW